ncbi:hypothetical protein Q0Z83_032450 [Actinoplanes sichuanensis]|uniref:HEAT repeat domain-containing protein n=1 Tax=Actinoplanes sichuanensis TaxID=512349 RepID=A0ABW4AS53_9ACTN|nr:hypothetical protein [Actinoplanes sichuanensis]BEL05054.1 hypothetical protein Q0Z83_032450 [Actinoplanes sichuanensis]
MIDEPPADLGTVPWAQLHHAYGPASDVPAHLTALRSPDPATRDQALDALAISVCHQGTRWEVSQWVVPSLIALIDAPDTPGRGAVLHLLTRIAVGDDDPPLDPATAFARTEILDRVDTTALVNRFHLEEDDFTDDEITLLDAVAVRWAADCYHRTAEHLPTITGWLTDPDDDVAARAAALTARLPPDPAVVDAWLRVPRDREQPRASANLALAHYPTTDPSIDTTLQDMTVTGSDLVAITAAVASAYRRGLEIDPPAVTVLIDAADRESLRDVVGWSRATRGFVMRALHRLGL